MLRALPSRHPGASSQRGFTLVEVIVVLSVVLLLTGIAVPMLSSYIEDGRRARAEAEARVLVAAVASFYKDNGIYPTRSGAGANNTVYTLVTGPTLPTTNPWLAGHQWATWALNATRGDLLDNHLLRNTPQNNAAGGYPLTGSIRWRGPYLAGSSPLDPWGRPYVINVFSGFSNHATNNRRMWVISAGPDGRFNTNAAATAITEVGGDDIAVMIAQRP